MAHSQAHDVVSMIVAHKAGSDRLTMPLVRGIMAELSTHPPECKCGCAWMTQTDAGARRHRFLSPGRILRNALYWQRQFAVTARAGQSLEAPPRPRSGRGSRVRHSPG
jgi:hypothetical protein